MTTDNEALDEPRIKFRPKLDKILELLLYLAHKRPGADHYQAVKFLYLADKAHLNRYGRPITFETYYALSYGPVASNALDLIKSEGPDLLVDLPFETEKLDNIVYIRAPKREVNYDLFSKSDLKVFDEILAKYGRYSFGELYNITHSHFAYRRAWGGRGLAKRAEMRYEDMIEESPNKASKVDALEDIASNI